MSTTSTTRENKPVKSRPPLSKWITIILIIAVTAFAIYLLVLAVEGFYTRYLADDYCYAVPAQQIGLFKGLADVYMRWSGRFSAIFFVFLGTLPGTWASTLVPLILILGLAGALYLLFKNIFRFWDVSHLRLKSLLMAVAATTIFSLLAPNRYQVLDWMNGSITYTGPMILLILLAAWFLHTLRVKTARMNWLGGIGIFLFAGIAAGFSETTAAESVAGVALFILVSLVFAEKTDKWRVVRWQIVAFAGVFTGFLIDALAPGNATRVGMMHGNRPSLTTLVLTSFKFGADYIVNAIRGFVIPVVVLLLLAAAIGFFGENAQAKKSGKGSWVKMLLPFLLILALGYLMIVAVCAPAEFFQGAFPENRAMSAGTMILVLMITLIGLFSGRIASRMAFKSSKVQTAFTVVSLAVVLISGVYAIRASFLHIPSLNATIEYSRVWDARDQLIRQQIAEGQKDIVTKEVTSQHGLSEFNQDPNFWVNICVAKYYQINSIRSQ